MSNKSLWYVADAVYALDLTGDGGCQPLYTSLETDHLPDEIAMDARGVSDQADDYVAASSSFDQTQSHCHWLHLDYTQEESAVWLQQTALLPDAVRDALAGESQRPRILRQQHGTLVTLRTVNLNAGSQPEDMVTLRMFLSEEGIISSRHRQVNCIEEVHRNLTEGCGPKNTGNWLVDVCDTLTEQAAEFIETLHDTVIRLEDDVLDQRIPEQGELALLRKQLAVLRRYLMPQRDIFYRLSSEVFSWMSDDDRHRMQEIAGRLGRELDDLDACITRAMILSDEITSLMAAITNRRAYVMSLMAMIFLPLSFLTGLFGVNLGGIPGNVEPLGFPAFCGLLVTLVIVVALWLKKSRWL